MISMSVQYASMLTGDSNCADKHDKGRAATCLFPGLQFQEHFRTKARTRETEAQILT